MRGKPCGVLTMWGMRCQFRPFRLLLLYCITAGTTGACFTADVIYPARYRLDL